MGANTRRSAETLHQIPVSVYDFKQHGELKIKSHRRETAQYGPQGHEAQRTNEHGRTDGKGFQRHLSRLRCDDERRRLPELQMKFRIRKRFGRWIVYPPWYGEQSFGVYYRGSFTEALRVVLTLKDWKEYWKQYDSQIERRDSLPGESR